MTAITIRNVPDDVRNELAARAARHGRSLQAELLVELTQLARRPTAEEVIERARRRVETEGTHLSAEQILAWRDADRK